MKGQEAEAEVVNDGARTETKNGVAKAIDEWSDVFTKGASLQSPVVEVNDCGGPWRYRWQDYIVRK